MMSWSPRWRECIAAVLTCSYHTAPHLSFILFAGAETTSGILGRILHQLALHPDVQDKLRAELCEARDVPSHAWEYDRLMGLPYLDAICKETLRMYVTFSDPYT